MTAPARITQADMERAAKTVKSAGWERARIVMDLVKGRIEIIVGESGEKVEPVAPEEWNDDDV